HFEPPDSIAELSVAAPVFLNIRLDPEWVAAQVGPIRAAGPRYGRASTEAPRRINVEFVSANPTGPLHVGNARGAFVGDVLSRVLSAAGHDVTREYY
ncbi:MAG: arginine--tRNA ligase, partial [Solirubrobacterales bacterium]|nr:arginine--tRNA ligase [Solirubrobacterales bacterium]